jgi:hypothetical protein
MILDAIKGYLTPLLGVQYDDITYKTMQKVAPNTFS